MTQETQEAPLWPIEYYVDSRGRCDVEDFIEGLSDDEAATLARHLQELEMQGPALRGPYSKKLRGRRGLCELRPKPNRLIYFIDSQRHCVVVLAFRKRSNRTPKKLLDKAERRMYDILESGQ